MLQASLQNKRFYRTLHKNIVDQPIWLILVYFITISTGMTPTASGSQKVKNFPNRPTGNGLVN